MRARRDPGGHKGTFGKVCVYGGCVGYTGAPVYAGEAAARTGSGLNRRTGSSPVTRTTLLNQGNQICARVVELADSLDSGSSPAVKFPRKSSSLPVTSGAICGTLWET